jgi:hypothetical protein
MVSHCIQTMLSLRLWPADALQVESTFLLNNNIFEANLSKVKISLEPFSPFHKVDSFSSWNASLLPDASFPNKANDAEHTLERNMDMGCGDRSGNLNGRSGLQEAISDLPIVPSLEYGAYNPESFQHTSIIEGKVPENMELGIVPGQNETSDLQEQYFRWQTWPWGSKVCRLEKENTLADNTSLYCEHLPVMGEASNLLGAS